MALPPLSTVAAMEVRLRVPVGSLAGLDLASAQASLADASALVRRYAKPVTWVDVDGVTITAPEEVVLIATRAAIRDYRNPGGVGNEALGSGAYAYGFAPGEATLALTDEEIATIRKAAAESGTDPNAWTGTGTVRTPSAYYDPLTEAPTGMLLDDGWCE